MVGVGRTTFVGREADLFRLQTALATRADRPGVFVGGEAGMGKTRLLHEFSEFAHADGATVISGGCLEIGADGLPFAPFVEALGRLTESLGPDAAALVGPGRDELAVLLPALGPAPPAHPDRVRLFEAVRALFDRVPDPTVLVLEDLHWADRSSLELLSYLVRRLRHGRTLIAASYRTDEVATEHASARVIAELARSGRADRMDLGGLSPADVERLVRDLAPTTPASARAAISARSEGNPYLAEELAVAGWSAGAELPPSLRDLLSLRVRGLGHPARRLLEIIAVAGRPVEPALLDDAWDGTPAELDVALAEAIGRGLVGTARQASLIALHHALVGAVVLDELLPREEARLHARLGTILAARPDLAPSTEASRAAELAGHWLGAGRDPEALDASFRAAEAAERLAAWSEAHAHYAQALRLWSRVPGAAARLEIDHGGILDHAAYVADMAGDTLAAVALERDAIAHGDEQAEPARVGARHAALACWLQESDAYAEMVAAAERAVELVPPAPASADRVLALFALAGARLLWWRDREAADLAAEAAAMAAGIGPTPTESWARALLGLAEWELGRDDRAAEELQRAVDLVAASGDVWSIVVGYTNLMVVLTRVGGPGATRLAIAAYREAADRRGLLRAQEHQLRTWEATVAFADGRWDSCATAATALVGPDPAGPLEIAGTLERSLLQLRGRIRVLRGEAAAGRADLQAARSLRAEGTQGSLVGTAIGLAEADLLAGAPAGALAEVDEAVAALAAAGLPPRLELHALGVRAAASLAARAGARHGAAGRAAVDREAVPAAAAPHRRAIERALAGTLVQGMTVGRTIRTLGTLGLAEAGRLDGCDDPELWAGAAGLLRGWAEPHLEPYARFRHAEALLEVGRRAQAVDELQAARVGAGRLGLEPLLAMLGSLARRARIDLPPSAEASAAEAPRELAASADATGLSPREREVLALLAEGLTNREIGGRLFISEKTASVHVTHILDKLGVASRGAAVAAAVRHGVMAAASGSSDPEAAALPPRQRGSGPGRG